MNFKSLLDEENAVSPVIGVILMVAITVILAAVIGTFVLGLGDNLQQTSPQVNFGFDYSAGNTDEVRITHDGGDSIDTDKDTLKVVGPSNSQEYTIGEMKAGDSVDFTYSGSSGDEIRVVWESAEGDKSATLGKSQIP